MGENPCDNVVEVFILVSNLVHELHHFVTGNSKGRAKCSIEPMSDPVHDGSWHIPVMLPVQCRVSWSVWYLPDNILACMTALLTSLGFEPHVNQIG